MEIKEIEFVDPLDFCENCGRENPERLYQLSLCSTRHTVVLCRDCLRQLMICILIKTGTL